MPLLVPGRFGGFSRNQFRHPVQRKRRFNDNEFIGQRMPLAPLYPMPRYYQPTYNPAAGYIPNGFNQFRQPGINTELELFLNQLEAEYQYSQYLRNLNRTQNLSSGYTRTFPSSYTAGTLYGYVQETRILPYAGFLNPNFGGRGNPGYGYSSNLGFATGPYSGFGTGGVGGTLPPKIRAIFIPTGSPSFQQLYAGPPAIPPFLYNRMSQPLCSLPMPPPLPRIQSLPLSPVIQQMVMNRYANPVAILPLTSNWQIPPPMMFDISQVQQQPIMPVFSCQPLQSAPQQYIPPVIMSAPQQYMPPAIMSAPQQYIPPANITPPQQHISPAVMSAPQQYIPPVIMSAPQQYIPPDIMSAPQQYIPAANITPSQQHISPAVMSAPQQYVAPDITSALQQYIPPANTSVPQPYVPSATTSVTQLYSPPSIMSNNKAAVPLGAPLSLPISNPFSSLSQHSDSSYPRTNTYPTCLPPPSSVNMQVVPSGAPLTMPITNQVSSLSQYSDSSYSSTDICPTCLPAPPSVNVPVLPLEVLLSLPSANPVSSTLTYPGSGYLSTNICRACPPAPPSLNIPVAGHHWIQHCPACHHIPPNNSNSNYRPTGGRVTPLLRHPAAYQHAQNQPMQYQRYPHTNTSSIARPWRHMLPPLPLGAVIISDEYIPKEDYPQSLNFSQTYQTQHESSTGLVRRSRTATTTSSNTNRSSRSESTRNAPKKHHHCNKYCLAARSNSILSSGESFEYPKYNFARQQLSAAPRNVNLRYNYPSQEVLSVNHTNHYIKSSSDDSVSTSNLHVPPDRPPLLAEEYNKSCSPSPSHHFDLIKKEDKLDQEDSKSIRSFVTTSSRSKKSKRKLLIVREYSTRSPSTISTISSNSEFSIIDNDLDSIFSSALITDTQTDITENF